MKVYKFIFLFLFCSNLFAQEKNLFLKENDKVIRLMTKFLQKNEIPGLSLSISYKKEIIFSKGFGFSDLKLRKEVNPSKTKFRIASISKTLTAVSLAKLQEEGKISFKESVYKYLDSLPKTNYDITIEDLLSHKAGLVRDYGGSILCEKNDFYKNSFYSSYNNDRFITAPQIGFSYSNYGYKLLGILIEKISGKTIQNVKNDLIINKIGLSNTTHETSNYEENTTKFYYKKDKEFLEVPCLDCTFNYGPGCYLSTSEDLVKLGNAYMYKNILLKPESFSNLIKSRNQAKDYGLGFITKRDYYKNYFFGHNGGYPGAISYLRVYPNNELVISILINYRNEQIQSDLESILNEIAFIYIEILN